MMIVAVDDAHALDRQQFIQMIETYVDESTAKSLWDLFTSIALLPYESSESTGTSLLAPDRSRVELVLVLNLPLTVAEVRGVRKLLQISSEDLSLLCDGAEIYGLGRSLEPYRVPLVEFQLHGRLAGARRAALLWSPIYSSPSANAMT